MPRTTVDREFCRRLPKVELHAHLSGSISRQCLHDVWKQKKEKDPGLELEDPLTAIPLGTEEYNLTTTPQSRLPPESQQNTNPTLTQHSFFPIFSSYIYKLCSDIPTIKYTTKTVLNDFEADNVVHLELRTTPRSIPENGITNEIYVQTVLEGVNEHNKRPDARMHVRLILSIDRRWTAKQADEIVDLAIKYRSRGVIAVDLCGDPAKGDVDTFKPAFAKAKAAGLKITLHFAESQASATDKELRSLLDMKPDRLGHVIFVKDEYKKRIVEQGIGVELCLSCNVQLKMISGTYQDHHFGWWRNSGAKLTISTDDVGVFCSPLSEEYYLASQHFGLKPEDVKKICETTIKIAFTHNEDKKRLTEWLHTWYQNTMAQ